jgi:hypothetical protein
VVAAARNDDHGGDPMRRLETFVSAFLEQSRRYHLPAEIVIVEWNPPADRPSIADALEWPRDPGPCAVRVITVPPKLHARYRHSQALELYQMIAKNAGIRRALGEFVVATNIDILFSNELVEFIAERQLEREKMYRIDRHDVMADIPSGQPVDAQLDWCASHLLRVNAARGTFSLTPDGELALEKNDIADAASGMRFEKGWYARELDGEKPFRWLENDAEIAFPAADSERTLSIEIEPGPGTGIQPFGIEIFDEREVRIAAEHVTRRTFLNFPIAPRTSRIRIHIEGGGRKIAHDPRVLNARVMRCGWGKLAPPKLTLPRLFERSSAAAPDDVCAPEFLHMTACGDFTLLARERWFDLRGYPEFDLHAMNIDALFCWMAHHGGAREVILRDPMRIYHVEHGLGWTPEGQVALFERLDKLGIPCLDYADVIRWARDMKRFDRPMIFNREDWGLAAADLAETMPVEPA